VKHAEYVVHVEALEASITALCAGDQHLHQYALDRVDRLTWAETGGAETTRARHVEALVSVILELRTGQLGSPSDVPGHARSGTATHPAPAARPNRGAGG
jgi:hypothetical protein